MNAHAKSAQAYALHDTGTLAPVLRDMFAYHRAVQQLQRVRQSIERVMEDCPELPNAFSLLLVEHRIWTRYVRQTQGLWMSVHTEGPESGEAVVLTGEVVLDAIATGQLSVVQAFRRGLLVVRAPAAAGRELKALLHKALTERGGDPLRIFPMHFPGKPR
jgi:hypothetical protein